ncbi:Quinohemoprotein alcohol dehydrogenase ADH-IIG [Planctomycetales bacterium 10988]|nr:Quinohemoprotein alcohol dehydrogenase ADH-IIG [Planctomycetales bacterium 10988]
MIQERIWQGLVLSCCLGLLQGTIATADEWPQWRGPERDGVWRETGIIKAFPEKPMKPLWEMPIAGGYSSPSVARDKVYVTDRLIEPTQEERIHCFDRKTGKSLWTHAYECIYRNVGYQAGPRASVLIVEDRAYALGTMGDFFCLNADTGKVLWHRPLNEEYGIRMPIWGIAASPIAYENLVIVQIGGQEGSCLVAFDQKSGEEVWRSMPDEASYSAPILIEQAGEEVLVCWTGEHIAGLDPAKGTVFWKVPFPPKRMVISISTPVVSGNMLFVTSFYDGSKMVELSPDKLEAKEKWHFVGPNERRTEALQSIIATPVFEGDYIYGVDSYGQLRCLSAETGERIWESQEATPYARWSNIHIVKQEDRYWLFNERGDLIIAQLSPEGYQEISRTKVIEPTTIQLNQRGGVCWAHPAYAHRCVFVRNDEKIICYDLSKQ